VFAFWSSHSGGFVCRGVADRGTTIILIYIDI